MSRFDSFLIRALATMLFVVWCIFAMEASIIVGWYSGQYLLRWITDR